MGSAAGQPDRPLRVAIVGSGPSGFYAAESLFRRDGLRVTVDLFDRLPTPYGLVRYGVAPDHQKMKAVTRAYEKTAAREGFRFLGNVELGTDLQVEDLLRHYDQVVYAFGSETDRKLGIPGEDLPGSFSSTSFVGWYNGHPDYRDLNPDLSHPRAAVFGVGNVAMDVARVLLRSTDELAETDIADYALDALRESAVREVVLIGRRGAAEAAFTPKELEELADLEGVDLVADPEQVRYSDDEVAALDTNARKNVEHLLEYAARGTGEHDRKAHIRFLISPVKFAEAPDGLRLTLEHNRLEPGDRGPRAVGTGRTEELDVGLVFRAVGYRGAPVKGVPFHEAWGIIPNEDGRVTEMNGTVREREYVVGWAKRGPTGLIGTNKNDSAATVDLMLEDLRKPGAEPAGPEALSRLLEERGVRAVSFDDWKLLDEWEVSQGEASGRVRRKVLGVDGMLAAIDDLGAVRSGGPLPEPPAAGG